MKISFPKISQSELSSPILTLLWSAWFLLFDAGNSGESYNRGRILSNREWAVVFLAACLLKIYTIIHGGIYWRQAATLLSALLWLLMAVLFAFSNWSSHAVPTCFFIAYINFLRINEIKANN